MSLCRNRYICCLHRTLHESLFQLPSYSPWKSIHIARWRRISQCTCRSVISLKSLHACFLSHTVYITRHLVYPSSRNGIFKSATLRQDRMYGKRNVYFNKTLASPVHRCSMLEAIRRWRIESSSFNERVWNQWLYLLNTCFLPTTLLHMCNLRTWWNIWNFQ